MASPLLQRFRSPLTRPPIALQAAARSVGLPEKFNKMVLQVRSVRCDVLCCDADPAGFTFSYAHIAAENASVRDSLTG